MATKSYKCSNCGIVVTYDEYAMPPGACSCGGWFYPY